MFKRILCAAFVILALLLVSGCAVVGPVQASACEELASTFDENVKNKGCYKDEKSIVGATLIDAREEIMETDEHIHYLTFKGANEEYTFKTFTTKKVYIPLKVGKFYKFEFKRACGLMYSMGPHNNMFSYENIDNFEEVSC